VINIVALQCRLISHQCAPLNYPHYLPSLERAGVLSKRASRRTQKVLGKSLVACCDALCVSDLCREMRIGIGPTSENARGDPSRQDRAGVGNSRHGMAFWACASGACRYYSEFPNGQMQEKARDNHVVPNRVAFPALVMLKTSD
jgi:hypothetical protein